MANCKLYPKDVDNYAGSRHVNWAGTWSFERGSSEFSLFVMPKLRFIVPETLYTYTQRN